MKHHESWHLGYSLCLLLALTGCASRGTHVLELMPAPDHYDEGVIDPFRHLDGIRRVPAPRG